MLSLQDYLQYLPAAACLFWVVIHFMMASRSSSFMSIVASLTVLGLFLCADHAVLALATGTSVIPLFLLYLDRLRKDQHPRAFKLFWIIAPAALLTAGVLMTLMPPSALIQNYKDEIWIIYNIIILVEIAAFALYLLYIIFREHYRPFSRLLQFFFKKKPISLLELQVCNIALCLAFFTIKALTERPQPDLLTAACIAVGIFTTAYVALFGTKSTITLQESRRLNRYNYNKYNKADIVEAMIGDMLEEAEEEALKRIQERIGENLHLDTWKAAEEEEQPAEGLAEHIFSAVASSWDDDGLLSRFQRLMMENQLFLQPGLSLQDVADKLDTNKTYVSKLVNNTYNLGFPELLNILRIDYAEQYLLNHRDARQSEVAHACGFQSASSFNNIFKKITGMTPKLWVANHDRHYAQR